MKHAAEVQNRPERKPRLNAPILDICLCAIAFLSAQLSMSAEPTLGVGDSSACLHLLRSNDFDDRAYAEDRARRLLEMRGEPIREVRRTFQVEAQDVILVYGVPERVQRVEYDPTRVFRHYTRLPVRVLVESSLLKSGPRPYIYPAPEARWIYEDLSGPMFTDPDFPVESLWMDFDGTSDWIEFTFPHPVPILKCAEGNYLIPAQKDYPDWIRKGYATFLENGVINASYPVEEFKRLMEGGGMRPRAGFQIRLVRYQEKGVIFSVSSPVEP